MKEKESYVFLNYLMFKKLKFTVYTNINVKQSKMTERVIKLNKSSK